MMDSLAMARSGRHPDHPRSTRRLVYTYMSIAPSAPTNRFLLSPAHTMADPTGGIHYVFGTSAPYSHAPAAIRLSIGIVTLDPTVRISVLIHANNVFKAEEILATSSHAKEKSSSGPWASRSHTKTSSSRTRT